MLAIIHRQKATISTVCAFAFSLFLLPLNAQIASSFELRYFSKDKEANGTTDFKGETEIFSTEQRIEYLENYAAVAGKWFMDSSLNQQVVRDEEVSKFLEELKPQPLPIKRKRLVLEEWSKYGYAKNDLRLSRKKISSWNNHQGVSIKDGKLIIQDMNSRLTREFDQQNWRFHLKWRAKSEFGNVPFSIALKNNKTVVAEAGFHSNGNIFYTDNGYDRMGKAYRPGEWYDFKLEVDLENNRYNLLVNSEKIGDWIKLKNKASVNNFEIRSGTGISVDDIVGLGFDTTGCTANHPYLIEPFIQEDFEIKPRVTNWMLDEYDDSGWDTDILPIVHGGTLEAGEDLYLRKKVTIGEFERAFLNIEALDPGGEIWINGEVVFVTRERHPVKIDISKHLLPYRENLIAIRVFSYYNDGKLYHSPQDRNIGWFCGRAWLDLTESTYIEDVSVFTANLASAATQHHLVEVVNDKDSTFEGELEINYYAWHPVEHSRKAASVLVPVRIFAKDSVHYRIPLTIDHPALWDHEQPNLYKISVNLLHKNKILDDLVLTTGIRTVTQEKGIFRINGKAELLGGAQTMGFRMPIENIAKWNRCAPSEVLAEELLACKKLGNTLRIHVHAGGSYAYSVNDPRVAEMADQLGLMLIWPTSSWIREGEWGGIDFEGYPKYIKQVFNSPGIVIWEGANHPNKFEGKHLEYTNRFIKKIVNTIADADSSRLIAPTSYNRHFEYRNNEGTIDKKGNPIVPVKEWTSPHIVRGNQDALTGYGREWSDIRKWPDPYRRNLLESPDHCYFNFEHEESIGMQDFSHSKGQPWYQMPSYENPYDIGSVGRNFEYSEWRTSQAWQAFSAYESMKWQRIHDVDGFSWCCLHGGPNSGTYRKPIIDLHGHAKLGFYANQMALQDILPGSRDTDVAYGKKDVVSPVIMNIGEERSVRLKVIVKNLQGTIINTKEYDHVILEEGRTVNKLAPFKHTLKEEGYYVFEYYVLSQ